MLDTQEHVLHGDGNSAFNGPVQLDTVQTAGTFFMRDPTLTNVSCQNSTGNVVFSGPDDLWGSGNGTNRETGCVDAFFAAQTEKRMMSQWLDRNGFNGSGGGWPVRVDLNDLNAFHDGSQIQIGHNRAGGWIGSLDVVAHEHGHGIDDTTPGGISRAGTQEFVGDVFGAATEWFANEPAQFDPPDVLVGEEVNLVGQGPIRNMFNPGALGDPNCYSSSVPGMEVHAAAGPGNHWFYLASMGSNPTNGQPTSATCNGSTVTGLGVQTTLRIFYNAMLMKTTASSYLRYRTWTLTAAINLFLGSCGEPAADRHRWHGATALDGQRSAHRSVGQRRRADLRHPTVANTFNVTVTATDSATPARSGSASFTWTIRPPGGGCSGQLFGNAGFESGNTVWASTPAVIGQNGGQGQPPRTGTWNAWLDGYGTTHTDTLSQSVSIPAGCTATLTFWLHIDTAETTTTTMFDRLTVAAGTTTLGTFSNLNRAAGYVQRTFNVSAFAGQSC